MEVVVGVGGGRRRMSKESTPERSRMGFQERERERVRALTRKVQIVYYLSRNGQLEHPHFMELSQLPNQQLRLKDVMEKLSVLRGVGMPSLFSWSCKRSYKNGYVWNDLSENDVIYPADGAEYVLKGSEIISGCSDRFQEFPLGNRHLKPLISSTRRQHVVPEEEEEDEEEEEEAEEEIGKQDSNNSHCSRGVSTEDMIVVHKSSKLALKPHNVAQTEITVDNGSPALSSSSSDPAAVEPASGMTRNSVLLQLIACGSSVAAKGGRKSGSLHAGVLSRAAVAASRSRVDNEYEENSTRFGCLRRIEDKEYFSGSIVEVIRKPADSPEPKLKKSLSFNEQRSSKLGFGEGEGLDLEMIEEREGLKGKCIPGRKRSSFKLPQIQWQAKK